jgi:hypothetical protein
MRVANPDAGRAWTGPSRLLDPHRSKPRVPLEIAFFLVFSFFSSYPLLTSKDPDFTVPYRSYRTVPYRMYTGIFLASWGWEGEGWARF